VLTKLLAGCLTAMLVCTASASAGAQPDPPLDLSPYLLAPSYRLAPFFTAPTASASPRATAQGDTSKIRFAKRQAVPRLPCRPGDAPETGLQGHVPTIDIVTGRSLRGYNCNLEVVGRVFSSGAGTLDSFGDCAYFGRGSDLLGTQVVSVADPARPATTGSLLVSPAMLSPWESLRVNAKRKLLVADHWSLLPIQTSLNNYLDIYDVSQDCGRPRLISSTNMAPANGHEGWFSPDGMTYYMSSTGPDGTPTTHPVDISDAAHPKLLASWTFPSQTHGGSTTEDGTRTFICQQNAPPKDQLLIVDTSEVAARGSNPKPHLLAQVPLEDNQWCQAAYRVTYDGKPFLIQYGERSGASDCSRSKDGWANYGYPRIFDLADERHPKLISSMLLEVDLPEHCKEVTGQGAINGLGYSVHHCSPDRLYDPTILACDYFAGGMRVMDIRDPYHPVEIGYYNPGATLIVGTGARPVVRAERGEIWFVNDVLGFYVVRFEDGIWPFKDAKRCPEFDDYYYAQYNPGSTCPTANFDGVGKPAPAKAPAGARRPRPELTLHVSPARDRRTPYRFRVIGRLVAPKTVARSRACRGSITLTVRGAGRSPLRRTLRIAPSCRVAATVTTRRRGRRLTFELRFRGNAALASSSRRAVVRAG
jgi:hypothetical protein